MEREREERERRERGKREKERKPLILEDQHGHKEKILSEKTPLPISESQLAQEHSYPTILVPSEKREREKERREKEIQEKEEERKREKGKRERRNLKFSIRENTLTNITDRPVF